MRTLRQIATIFVVAVLLLATGCAAQRYDALVNSRSTLRPVPLAAFDGLYIDGFFTPGEDRVGNGLYLLEPYRPGAIPVIFVHGLVSDPSTWIEMHTRLRNDPLIANRFQFWAFRYETGPSYLGAAADLRDELMRVRSALDPRGSDRALSQAVLVGHSMGGLVSKLQVTHSDDHLWRTMSQRSPDEIHADPQTRNQITRLFFFNPQPGIARLVYIATPHRGSPIAVGRLGNIGERLVGFPKTMVSQYNTFLQRNTDIFPNLPQKPPTSVDLLKPCHPVLRATTRLRFAPGIAQHVIYGVGQRTSNWCRRDGDGYVTVSSARWPLACSEKPVNEAHTEVHKHRAAIDEVRRILTSHAMQAP